MSDGRPPLLFRSMVAPEEWEWYWQEHPGERERLGAWMNERMERASRILARAEITYARFHAMLEADKRKHPELYKPLSAQPSSSAMMASDSEIHSSATSSSILLPDCRST